MKVSSSWSRVIVVVALSVSPLGSADGARPDEGRTKTCHALDLRRHRPSSCSVELPRGGRTRRRSGRSSERVRGRIFRLGTVVILLAVGAAIVIPAIHGGNTAQAEKVAVVGAGGRTLQPLIEKTAAGVGDPGQGHRRGHRPSPPPRRPSRRHASTSPSSTASAIVRQRARRLRQFVDDVQPWRRRSRRTLGESSRPTVQPGSLRTQVQQLDHAKPVPVESLQPGRQGPPSRRRR